MQWIGVDVGQRFSQRSAIAYDTWICTAIQISDITPSLLLKTEYFGSQIYLREESDRLSNGIA